MVENDNRTLTTVDKPECGNNGKGGKLGMFASRLSLSAADIRHNLMVLVLIDCIWTFGYSEVSLAGAPLYVYLHMSNKMIGIIGGSQVFGLLGVFLSPFITRRFPTKKLYLLIVHIPYILPWGLIGIALIVSRKFGLTNGWLIGCIVWMNCISGFFAGFVSLPHQEYVASCVPMSHRGRLSGYANSIGSGAALISNMVAGWILYTMAKPMAFGWLYVMTWLICQSGYVLALFGRELRTPVENAAKPWSKQMIMAALKDAPYMRVIGLYSFYIMFFFPVWTFVAVYGFRELGMNPAASASMGIVAKIATLLTAAQCGRLVDKYSPKRALLYPPLALIAALLPVIFWHNPLAIYANVAIGVLFGIVFQASMNTLLYGLPKPENRAGHYTFQLLACYVSLGIGQFIVGAACDKFGYRPTFTLLALLAVLVFLLSKRILSILSDKVEDYS